MVLTNLQITKISRQISYQIFDSTNSELSDHVYYIVFEDVYDQGLLQIWNQLFMHLVNI